MMVDLDKLQSEIEKLLLLLKDCQPGLFTWNDCLRERIASLHYLLGNKEN